jgi:tetratricopeptide (TPR) repeat protein
MTRLLVAALAIVCIAIAPPADAQIPQRFENLQELPTDIPRDTLIEIMRGFTRALGVRCTHCHTGGTDQSLEGMNFASDDKLAKQRARFMMRMVSDLNTSVLDSLPGGRGTPAVRVTCVTCHRGLSRPATLESVLAATIDSLGVPAAVTQYRDLRRETMALGRYDFGETSINELARALAARGKTAEAIGMLELNGEFHPSSAAIDFSIAELHRQRGERDQALRRYRMVLEKAPNHRQAQRRLEEMGGGRGRES